MGQGYAFLVLNQAVDIDNLAFDAVIWTGMHELMAKPSIKGLLNNCKTQPDCVASMGANLQENFSNSLKSIINGSENKCLDYLKYLRNKPQTTWKRIFLMKHRLRCRSIPMTQIIQRSRWKSFESYLMGCY